MTYYTVTNMSLLRALSPAALYAPDHAYYDRVFGAQAVQLSGIVKSESDATVTDCCMMCLPLASLLRVPPRESAPSAKTVTSSEISPGLRLIPSGEPESGLAQSQKVDNLTKDIVNVESKFSSNYYYYLNLAGVFCTLIMIILEYQIPGRCLVGTLMPILWLNVLTGFEYATPNRRCLLKQETGSGVSILRLCLNFTNFSCQNHGLLVLGNGHVADSAALD